MLKLVDDRTSRVGISTCRLFSQFKNSQLRQVITQRKGFFVIDVQPKCSFKQRSRLTHSFGNWSSGRDVIDRSFFGARVAQKQKRIPWILLE